MVFLYSTIFVTKVFVLRIHFDISYPYLVDCSNLPESMNGDSFPKGCPGALWFNGDPSETYCTNDENYPWWQKCCRWTGTECVPNGNSA